MLCHGIEVAIRLLQQIVRFIHGTITDAKISPLKFISKEFNNLFYPSQREETSESDTFSSLT